MQSLTSLFGSMALLAVIVAGFTIMFAPTFGRQLLKNTVIAIRLFCAWRHVARGVLLGASRVKMFLSERR